MAKSFKKEIIIGFVIVQTIFLSSWINCRFLDVLLIDDTSETTQTTYAGAMTTFLELAICQKGCPIITTNQIFYNVLKRKIGEKKQQYEEAGISLDGFDIYKSSDNIFHLLIPPTYKEKILAQSKTDDISKKLSDYKKEAEKIQKEDVTKDKEFMEYHAKQLKSLQSYTEEEILLGFRISPASGILTLVPNNHYDEVANIEAIPRIANPDIVGSVMKIFVAGKGDFFGFWNIVLGGHGSYPKNVNLDLTINSIVKQLDEAETYIAGLKLPEFRNFLQFLVTKLNLNFFYYATCFGGDLNLVIPYITTLINQRIGITKISGEEKPKAIKETIVSLEKPNFTIAVGATTSQAVSIFGGGDSQCILYSNYKTAKTKEEIEIKKKYMQGYINFYEFFKLLTKYSNDKNTQPPVKFKEQELKEILTAITPRVKSIDYKVKSPETGDPYGLSGLPSVMFPGTEKFVAVALDYKISVLSDVSLKTHQFEYDANKKLVKTEKPFIFDGKEAILIYPEEINPEIIIDKKTLPYYPSIVSMIPGLSLHKFEHMKIQAQFDQNSIFNALENFIKNSFTYIKPASPKYFYIKKLTISNTPGQNPNNVIFTDVFILSQVNQIFFALCTDDQNNILLVNLGQTTKLNQKNQAIPNNSFLNSIYNYFYLNNSSAREFKANNLNMLLTKEELDILNKIAKPTKTEPTKEPTKKSPPTKTPKTTDKTIKKPTKMPTEDKTIVNKKTAIAQKTWLAKAQKATGPANWAKMDVKQKNNKAATMKANAIKAQKIWLAKAQKATGPANWAKMDAKTKVAKAAQMRAKAVKAKSKK